MSELDAIRRKLKATKHAPAIRPLVSTLRKQLQNYANEGEAGKTRLRPMILRNVGDIERVMKTANCGF